MTLTVIRESQIGEDAPGNWSYTASDYSVGIWGGWSHSDDQGETDGHQVTQLDFVSQKYLIDPLRFYEASAEFWQCCCGAIAAVFFAGVDWMEPSGV